MKDSIILDGVSTHNLKNINVEVIKNKITVIYGRSGAGKTSLAFSSLYQLCRDEFEALEQGYFENNDYKIQNYENLIPAVAITQKNTNNNPKSTLYSFLNISYILQSIIVKNNLKEIFPLLKINKLENICRNCNGLGEVISFQTELAIDKTKSIIENPFLIWKQNKSDDYYYQLLLAFCEAKQIDITVPFFQLTSKEQYELTHYSGQDKIIFKAKYAGKYKQRRDVYQGVEIFAKNYSKLTIIDHYSQKSKCPACLGSRINLSKYKPFKIDKLSFVDFLIKPFDELIKTLPDKSEFSYLKNIIHQLCELKLGYLNFARSIPSLSGGELQKIKFSKLLNSNISGVLIVIDEISSQLSEDYYSVILNYLKKLSKNNTIVLVEHSKYFIDNADKKIHIGLVAGKQGGYVCNDEKILPIVYQLEKAIVDKFIEIRNISKHNVKEQNVQIPLKALTVFKGVSGSGKSSIAKFIEENYDAIYISQKTANYSTRSTLANTLKCQEYIADFFANHTHLPKELFLLNKDGGCPECQGLGVVKYERSFDKDIVITCPTCQGQLFDLNNIDILSKINGYSIIDIYQLEISELYIFFKNFDSVHQSLLTILNVLISLGLGHLQLNRKTQTLSGGELRRIRLCEHFARQRESKKILIIDEPIAGLDPETASKIAYFIKTKIFLYSSIIVIEHRAEIMPFCDFVVEIGPFAGESGGKVISAKSINL
ncbi:ATP-binding cassette domain-containing protein [Ursidibacter arcticus]